MPDPSQWIIAYLVLAVLWIVQFASLMVMDDKFFPGTYDKPIWGAAFLLAFPLAPFAFLVWKSAYKSYIKAMQRR